MLQYPGHEARARAAQSTGCVEEDGSIAFVEAHVQVVAVACPFQVRLRGHRGLESHPVCHAPDRLEYHHALVRCFLCFYRAHRELEVALPDLSVALLGTNANLL